jgi:hypothetical protein
VILEEAGWVLVPSHQALSDAMRDRIRLELGQERYDNLTGSGRELGLQAAIELADEVFARYEATLTPIPLGRPAEATNDPTCGLRRPDSLSSTNCLTTSSSSSIRTPRAAGIRDVS